MIGVGTTIFLVNPTTFPSGVSYLLDDYTAAAAYSLRQLKTGVTNVVRVRRSGDLAESDFTADEVSDGTLLTWVTASGTFGYVVKWYDQSGNNNDLTQTTSVQAPLILSGGSLIAMSNGYGMSFDGTNDSLGLGANLTALNTAPFSIWGLGRNTATTDAGIYFDQRDASSPNYGVNAFIDRRTNKAQFVIDGDGAADQYNLLASDDTSSNRIQSIIIDSSLNGDSYLNGTLQESITTTNTTINGGANLTLGYQPAGSVYFKGVLGEIIIFNSDESANRTTIESDINTHYSIY